MHLQPESQHEDRARVSAIADCNRGGSRVVHNEMLSKVCRSDPQGAGGAGWSHNDDRGTPVNRIDREKDVRWSCVQKRTPRRSTPSSLTPLGIGDDARGTG